MCTASNSPKRSHKHSLSNETPPSSTPLSTNQSTPNISLDSLSTHSSNSSHGGVTSSADPNLLSVSSKSEEGLEGDEGRQLSDYSSSGVNSVGGTPHSGSVASFEEKVRGVLPTRTSQMVYKICRLVVSPINLTVHRVCIPCFSGCGIELQKQSRDQIKAIKQSDWSVWSRDRFCKLQAT